MKTDDEEVLANGGHAMICCRAHEPRPSVRRKNVSNTEKLRPYDDDIIDRVPRYPTRVRSVSVALAQSYSPIHM